MDIEKKVAAHYGQGGLAGRVLAAIEQSGLDPAAPKPEDLAPIDEFHIGGRPATLHFAEKLGFQPGGQLLDLGCGLGGAARFIAAAYECHVTGLDLTPAYIEVARLLSERSGTGSVSFEVGSALEAPFEAAAFDGAYTIHVAMNIQDRAGLYREAARVLKPGAVFGVYDVMKGPAEGLTYPVPWAESAETSHLTSPDEMRGLLEQAGFELLDFEDRRDFAIDFFEQMRARLAESGPPPLGLHILMGENFQQKIANMMASLEENRILPAVMTARKSA